MKLQVKLKTAIACAVLAAGSAQAADFEPRLTLDAPQGPRTVALTLDACAGGVDRRVLDALVQSNAKATVFVTERWLKRNPQALADLKARPDLFEIENHGRNHVPVVTDAAAMFGLKTARTPEAVRDEIEGGAKAVEAATGARPAWFRGATARYSRDALQIAGELGMKVAGYSLNADMGASLPAGAVARRIAAARNGDVVIAHVNQPDRPAGQGVADGIRALAASGARFVTLNEGPTRSDDGREILVARSEARKKPAARAAAAPAAAATPTPDAPRPETATPEPDAPKP